FTVTNNKDNISIKIFSPSKKEEKTFRLSYVIKNVAVKYNDTGELYYKFLGRGNDTPIGFFRVNVKLPDNINNRVKIFAHGPLNGNINFKGDDLVKLEVDDVLADTFVEARILFPVDFIPNSTHMVRGNKY